MRYARIVSHIVKETLSAALRDGLTQLAAAQAFYTVFSLAPMLVLAVSGAGYVFGREAARDEIVTYVARMFNREMADFVRNVIMQTRESLPLATLIGAGSLLFAGSVAFVHLKTALNQIWNVADDDQPLLTYIKQRLLSMLGIFAVAMLLLVSITASAVVTVSASWLGRIFSIPVGLIQTGEIVIVLAVTTVLFVLIYRLVPDVNMAWSDLWLGATVSAVLFNAGLRLIGLYLGHGTTASAYGAAGSLFALLLWIYYSSMVFFAGAEFTKVIARLRRLQRRNRDDNSRRNSESNVAVRSRS